MNEDEITYIIRKAKISALKSVLVKPHGGEDKSQDYIDGYNESQGKIAFEVQRLTKLLEKETN